MSEHSWVTLTTCGVKSNPRGEAGHALTKVLAHMTSSSVIPKGGQGCRHAAYFDLIQTVPSKTQRDALKLSFVVAVAQCRETKMLQYLVSGNTFCPEMCSGIKE